MATLTIFVQTPHSRLERLVSPHSSLLSLRQKIEQLTGLPSSSLNLSLAGHALSEDASSLSELGIQDGDTVMASSNDASAVARLAGLDDEAALARVEKFELTSDEYAARRGASRPLSPK